MQKHDQQVIGYGAKVVIKDRSGLHGQVGIVIRARKDDVLEVLLEQEVIWPTKLSELELAM